MNTNTLTTIDTTFTSATTADTITTSTTATVTTTTIITTTVTTTTATTICSTTSTTTYTITTTITNTPLICQSKRMQQGSNDQIKDIKIKKLTTGEERSEVEKRLKQDAIINRRSTAFS